MRFIIAAALVPIATLHATATEPSPREIHAAVEKALPLLQKGAAGHMANRTCFACHNQALPVLALTKARERGLPVDAAAIDKNLKFIAEFLASFGRAAREGQLDTVSADFEQLTGRSPQRFREVLEAAL